MDVKGPLIERIPPGAPELAGFDATAADVDHRRSLTTDLKPSSEQRYKRCWRRYQEWCAEAGYQDGADRVDAEKLREFTVYMTTVKRYAVETIWHTIRAIQLYAERAGVNVSPEPALGVLDSYREALARQGEGSPPSRRRRRT